MEVEFLRNTFAILIIPPDHNPDNLYGVWLMRLNARGEPDFEQEEFVLARTTTLDAANNYAKKLADLLQLDVFGIQKT